MNEDQYQLIAPAVFDVIQDISDRHVESWKTKDGFYIKVPNNFVTTGNHVRLYESESFRVMPKGKRFSFSFQDELFLRDIYFQEINSPTIKNHLSGLARFGDKLLQEQRINGFSKNFQDLVKVKKFAKILKSKMASSLPPYLLMEMMRYWPKGTRNSLWPNVFELVSDLTGYESLDTPQSKMAKSVLPDPEKRLGDIALRTIRENKEENYLVLEVFPKKEEIASPPF